MGLPKKLVCDRCGTELSDRDNIELALEGMEAWHNSVRSRGEEPRGFFPCEHHRLCGGEMKRPSKKLFRWGGDNHQERLRSSRR